MTTKRKTDPWKTCLKELGERAEYSWKRSNNSRQNEDYRLSGFYNHEAEAITSCILVVKRHMPKKRKAK